MRPEIILGLLTRGTQALVLLSAAICVVWRLNGVEQGVFFFFISLGTLLQLSDFGLSYASLQTASHFSATTGGTSFASFRRKAHQLNFGILLAAALAITAVGALILRSKLGLADPEVHWVSPWLAFMLTVFLTQLVNLELTLIEGGKSAPLAWCVRLIQELVAGIVFITALLGGAGLWSLAAYWGMRFLFTVAWLSTTRQGFARTTAAESAHFDWHKEVWAFQWKLGLSSLCGFLIFQAFNPIVLLEQGPVVAGRFSMSLALMNILLMVTTVWPFSQAARYGALVRRQRYGELRHAFRIMCAASTITAMAGALLLFLCLAWLGEYRPEYADRFADPFTTGLLLATAVVHHITQCFSVLLRAERRDPLLPFTLLGSVLTIVAVWTCARFGQVSDIALANLIVTLPGVAVVIYFYMRRRTQWLPVPEARL
jgi:hypothetical protein